MKKITTIAKVLIIICTLFSIIGIYVAVNSNKLSDFTHVASGTYAKWMCSCLFVEGRNEEDCHNLSRHFIPINTCKIDYDKRSVTVKAVGRKNSADYVSKKLGCTLK